MTKPQDTRKVQQELRDAGFQPGHQVSSHTTWFRPSGVKITVPDGHRQISAGVYGTIVRTITEATSREERN